MARSLKKGPYVEESLLRKVEKMQAAEDKLKAKIDKAAEKKAAPKKTTATKAAKK